MNLCFLRSIFLRNSQYAGHLTLTAILLLGPYAITDACFILVLTDEQSVIVGNHEDWFETDAAIRIIPGNSNRYGSVIMTFMSEGWAQGGMNEAGLFFDGALTPYDPVEAGFGKQVFKGHIWQKVLDECATVAQALDTLRQYHLPDLEEVHIVLADAYGDAVILGTQEGKVAEIRKIGAFQLQTNFNPLQPELSDEPGCWRFETAMEHLSTNQKATEENMLEILAGTHQDELTIYSNIYNLTAKRITVFPQRRFDNPLVINLAAALRLGAQMISIDSLARNPNLFTE